MRPTFPKDKPTYVSNARKSYTYDDDDDDVGTDLESAHRSVPRSINDRRTQRLRFRAFFDALMVHVVDTTLVAYTLIHLLREEVQINTLHGSFDIVGLDYV